MQEAKENSLMLNPALRILMLVLIIVELIGLVWGNLLFVNYTSFSMPFLDYESLITAQRSQTYYAKNASLYILFWLQHIFMSTLKYKLSIFKNFRYYVLFERYIFNISSAITLWFIYYNVKPSYHHVFTISQMFCLPLFIIGVLILSISMLQLGEKILMPYKIGDIFNAKYIKYDAYDATNLKGIKINGIYSYLRHPLQSGILLIMLFGDGIYTVDKTISLAIMGTGIIIGVLMEQKRMLTQFSDYKPYMQTVKARFIPYMHFIGL